MSFPYKTARTRASAFTLVELMIVIAIIGVLASLVTVGVMKALERGKLVSARIEISQLEAAVAAAKLDLGNVDELPSVILVQSNIPNFSTNGPLPGETAFQAALRQKTWQTFQKTFGKNVGKHPVSNAYYQPVSAMNTSPDLTKPMIINWPCPSGKVIQGMEALVFWLGGVPNLNPANNKYSFIGFSPGAGNGIDRFNPCETAASKRKGPYYEFDANRIATGKLPGSSFLSYFNGWDGEYAYFSNGSYKLYANSFSAAPANNTNQNYSTELNSFSAVVAPYLNGNVFFNPKTFQIVSSGQNQTFGTGGSSWSPGSGKYAIDAEGYDDMSNFSSTLLGKKDE